MSYAFVCALVRALAPPTEWDVLAYHLALPKLHAAAGAVREIPWLLHSHWPHLMEAVYAIPLLAGWDRVPALLHLAACAAWIGAAGRAISRESGRETGLLAAALLAANPGVLRFSGTAHADGAWALFHLLTALCLLERRVALAGVFAGLAVSCKLLGLLALPGWALWLALGRERGGVRAAARFSAAAALVAAPWFVKTYLATGNPVWPFYSSWLGGSFGAGYFSAAYEASNRLPWPPPLWMLARNGLPWLAFSLAAAAALRPRGARVPDLLRLLWFPLPLHLLLTATHQEFARFLTPFYPAFAYALAWACVAAWKKGTLRRAGAALAAGVALAPAAAASCGNELFGALSLRSLSRPGLEPRKAYLSRALDHFEAYERFNARLAGTNARVLLFREIRGYYLDVPYLWGDPVNQGLVPYAALGDDRDLEARLRLLGVTHVLVNEGTAMYRPGGPVYDERTHRMMSAVLARGTLAESSGELKLYELRAF